MKFHFSNLYDIQSQTAIKQQRTGYEITLYSSCVQWDKLCKCFNPLGRGCGC